MNANNCAQHNKSLQSVISYRYGCITKVLKSIILVLLSSRPLCEFESNSPEREPLPATCKGKKYT